MLKPLEIVDPGLRKVRMIKQIDDGTIDTLISRAQGSARKRAHLNLHPELNDPVQRLFIAMEPETYVRPHRHADPETWEILLIVRGSLVLNLFDHSGMIAERGTLNARGRLKALEIPGNTWHAPAALEPGTVVFEIKQGPYKPIDEKNLAVWAPTEGDPGVEIFLNWYRTSKAGDMPPSTKLKNRYL